MNKLSSKALLGIAVVLSLITSMMVYNYLKSAANTTAKETQPVVVAKVDIPPKTTVTADMVQVLQVPKEYIQPGAINDQKLIVGIVTREQIVSGEQITERRLVISGKSVGFSGIIPKDKRAVTVAVTEVTGVAGFVKAGDYVDVIATFDQNSAGDNVSHLILQNIQVLASNRDTEAGVNAADRDKKDVIKTSTVTLAVTPDEAAKLALSEEKGKIRMALRPYMPDVGVVLTAAVTPKDLVGEHLGVNKSPAPAPAAPPDGTVREMPGTGKGIITIRGSKVETVPVN